MPFLEPDKEINVHDAYKDIDIVKISSLMTCPYSLMILNCHGDFNIATLTRTGSCLGASTVYTVGRRKFDRRPLVGCHNYTNVVRLSDLDGDPVKWFSAAPADASLKTYKKMFPVFIEQGGMDLSEFKFSSMFNRDRGEPCLVVGSECDGIGEDIMSLFPDSPRLSIGQPGVIRSLNVCNAGAMAMERMYYSYRSHVIDKYGLF